MSQFAQRKSKKMKTHFYLWMAVCHSRSNEVVWRDGGPPYRAFFDLFFIAFAKLGAGTDIRYDASTRENENTWLFLDNVLFFFFQMQALKWKSSFLFNLKWTQKGSGRSPPASPAKTANGVSGKMTLFVGVLAHLSLYIALRWAHSGPVISTPFRKKVMLMAFT